MEFCGGDVGTYCFDDFEIANLSTPFTGTEEDGIEDLFSAWDFEGINVSELPECKANYNTDGTIGSYSLQNGSFDEGLRYWGLNNRKKPAIGSKLRKVATVETDPLNEKNKALKLNITTEQEIADNIGIVVSAPFTIPNVSAGDGLRVKFKVYSDSKVSANFELYQSAKNNGSTTQTKLLSSNGYGDRTVQTVAGQWNEIVISGNSNWAAGLPVQTGENSCFYITIRLCNASTIYFDDFDIEVTKKSKDFVGKEDTGITSPSGLSTEWDLTKITVDQLQNGLQNGDFSQGLKYWGLNPSKKSNLSKASDVARVVEDPKNPENKVLKVGFTPSDANNSRFYKLVSAPFKLDGVKAGDVLNAKFKLYCTENDRTGFFNLYQVVNGESILLLSTHAFRDKKLNTVADQWTDITITQKWVYENGVDVIDTVPVQTGENSFFYFEFGPASAGGSKYDQNIDYYFDDFKIEVAGNQDPNPIVPEESTNDANGVVLTAKKNKVSMWEPLESFENFDFSNGLKNFGPRVCDGNAYWPSLAWEGITCEDGMLKAVKNKNNPKGGTGMQGFTHIAVKLPDSAKGKKVSLKFDYASNAREILYNVHTDKGVLSKSWRRVGKAGDVNSKTLKKNVMTTAYNWIIPEDASIIYFNFMFTDNSDNVVTYFDNFEYIFEERDTSTDMPDGKQGDEYGTYEYGVDMRYYYGKTFTPTDGPKNLDFSEGFKYWFINAENANCKYLAEIVKQDDNTYFKYKPDPYFNEDGLYNGIRTVPFRIKANLGDRFTLMYDWKGDVDFVVELKQCNVVIDGKTTTLGLCTGGPTQYVNKYAETDDDWSTSWQYVLPTGKISEDTSDDGYAEMYITIRGDGEVSHIPESYIDNIRVLRIVGDGKDATLYDLDGNVVENNVSKNDSTGDDPDEDPDDDSNNQSDNDQNNTNSDSDTNSNSGTLDNEDSKNNYGFDDSINQGDYRPNDFDPDNVDLTEILAQLESLRLGEKVDFITLFDLKADNGYINTYVAINTLSDKQLDGLLNITEEQLKYTIISLRAILSTLNSTVNSENAKAFIGFGGKAANTLPLSFIGHINLDFPVNVRIKLANDLDSETKYYAYRCNPDTREIDSLGQVYLENQDGSTYITLRTDKFSDFFISPDKLKGIANKANANAKGGSIPWGWIIGGGAGLLIIAGTTVGLMILKKKKRIRI